MFISRSRLGLWGAALVASAALLGSSGCVVGGVVAVKAISNAARNGKKLVTVERHASLEHAGPVVLDISTQNGSIAVRRHSGTTVEIDAEFKMIDRARADGVAIKIVRDAPGKYAPGRLSLSPDWPDGAPAKRKTRSEGASFTVLIPETSGLVLRTSNGSVTVAGLGGACGIDTSNGAVSVSDHAGSVLIETGNGSVVVSNADGAVTIDTSNGRVEVSGSAGPVVVDTSNGSIDVDLPPDANGPVTLDTSNGSVELSIGPAFGGELIYGTSNAKVRLRGLGDARIDKKGKRSGVVHFANPGGRSRIDTSNGSITIKQDG